MISEYFKKEIEKINILEQIPLSDYLKASLKSDNKDLCNGWDYLKNNLTKELKNILLNEEYYKSVYNADMIKFILNKIDTNLSEELKKQLGSFVYVWKDIKRNCETREQEDKLKKELLERGFKEQELIRDKEYLAEELKKLDGLKVKCVMDISKMGVLGSFDKKEELEGKFFYSESNKGLMLIPKRFKKNGLLIRNKFYYKEVKK